MHKCPHCGKILSTQSALRRHQKTVISCLRIQGQSTSEHICLDCNKGFSRSDFLERHILTSCKESKTRKVKEKEEELANILREYEGKIKRLAKRLKKQDESYEAKIQRLEESYEEKIKDLETKLLVSEAKLELQTANVINQTSTTNNNIPLHLGELTPEVGLLLAEKITQKEFWEGQRGLGRALRDLRDEEERPFFEVKDENRMKYEVRQGDQKIRDDRAEKIIETVKVPVSKKIGTIQNDLIDGADSHFAVRIMDQAVECLGFSSPDGNTRFLQGLSSKNG